LILSRGTHLLPPASAITVQERHPEPPAFRHSTTVPHKE